MGPNGFVMWIVYENKSRTLYTVYDIPLDFTIDTERNYQVNHVKRHCRLLSC